jgi:hypothetical protein
MRGTQALCQLLEHRSERATFVNNGGVELLLRLVTRDREDGTDR